MLDPTPEPIDPLERVDLLRKAHRENTTPRRSPAMPDMLSIACASVSALHHLRPLSGGWQPIDVGWSCFAGEMHATARPAIDVSIELTAEPGSFSAWWHSLAEEAA